jgi:molybdate transport system substrate-binding protein
VLVFAATLAACRAERPPLHVAAAVSLTESLTAAVRQWERETGETVALNFAASNVLSRQIEEGAPTALFVSADTQQMERLVVRHLVEAAEVVPLVTNQLVVITPSDRPLHAPPPGGLADPSVTRIALGDPAAVPAGVYARQWLERIDLWPLVSARVVPTGSVRAALAAIEAGNADAAIVYRTDAIGRERVRIAYEVDPAHGPRVVYPAAVVTANAQSARAKALLTWLQTAEARRVFVEAGFGVPAGPSAR